MNNTRVIKGPDNEDLSFFSEIAYLYCQSIGDSLSQWIDERNGWAKELGIKKIICKALIGVSCALVVMGGVLYGYHIDILGDPETAGIVFGIIGLVLFITSCIFLHLFSKRLIEWLAQKPPFWIKEFTKCIWSGELVTMGKKTLLVDHTGIFPSRTLEFSSLNQGFDLSVALLASLKQMLEESPVISPYSVSAEAMHCISGSYETGLIQQLDVLKEQIDDQDKRKIDLSLVPPNNDLSQSTLNQSLREEWVNRVPVTAMDESVKELHSLYEASTVVEEVKGGVHPEEALTELEQTCGTGLEELDKSRKRSIVAHLEELLNAIENSFELPMVRLVCPACYERASQVLSEDEEAHEVRIHATQSSKEKQDLEDRGRLFKASTIKCDISLAKFYCKQCGEHFDIDDLDGFEVFRVKEELVDPLWDRLWSELSDKHYQILREKEEELRNNKLKEHEELNQAGAEFAHEKRALRNRLDNILEACKKSEKSIEGLLEALRDMGLIDAKVEELYREMTSQDQEAIAKDIDKLREYMTKFEDEMEKMVQAVFNDRVALVDEVDQVKKRGRFFSFEKSQEEDLRIAF